MINKELDTFGRYGIRSIEKENDKKLAKMGNNTSNDNKSEASKPADQQRRASSNESKRQKTYEHENETEQEKQSSAENQSQSQTNSAVISNSSQNSSSTNHKEHNGGSQRPQNKNKNNYSRNNWNSNYQNGTKHGSTWPRQKVVHPSITESAKGRLTKEQAVRCKSLLETPVQVVSKDNTKQFSVIPLDLIFKLKNMLRSYGINPVKDGIRFVGSGTAYVLSDPANKAAQEVNDLDFCIYINHDTRNGTRFMEILQIEEQILAEMIQDNLGQRMNLREVYDLFFLDSVKVDTLSPKECWSLVTIGQKGHKTIDIRVVYHSSRSWVFSADSFEIIMDKMFRRKPQKQTTSTTSSSSDSKQLSTPQSKQSTTPVLLPSTTSSSEQPIKEHKEFKEQLLIQPEEATSDQTTITDNNNKPPSKPSNKPPIVSQWQNPPSIPQTRTKADTATSPRGHSISNVPPPTTDAEDDEIVVESLYGDYKEALEHLHKNLLCTKDPQDIRKGMLRYCYELAKGRTPKPEDREMLDKIFLDSFMKEKQQNFEEVLSKFLLKHSVNAEEFLKELGTLLAKSTNLEDMELYLAIIERLQEKHANIAKGNA